MSRSYAQNGLITPLSRAVTGKFYRGAVSIISADWSRKSLLTVVMGDTDAILLMPIKSCYRCFQTDIKKILI